MSESHQRGGKKRNEKEKRKKIAHKAMERNCANVRCVVRSVNNSITPAHSITGQVNAMLRTMLVTPL